MRYVQQNGILVPQTSRNRQRGFITCGPAFFGGGAPAPPSFVYFDPARSGSGIVLTNSNATATGGGSGWNSVASITKHSVGKWYAECSNDVVGGSGYMMFGAAPTTLALNTFPGSTATSYGEQPTNTGGAKTYTNGVVINSPAGFIAAGGRGCIAIDFGAGGVWFGDSNATGGRWYSGNPSTGLVPSMKFTPGLQLTLMLGLFGSGQTCTLYNNAGENMLTVPSGFSMWG